MCNYIGKTLMELGKECGVNYNGYAVFALQDENDILGVLIDEKLHLGLILKKHPEYANWKVKFQNDYYGTTVLRVEKGGD